MIRLTIALALLWLTSVVHAESCQDNFFSNGSVFTTKHYETWAVLPNTQKLEAFTRVLAYTVENGFTVLSSDRDAGTISAVNSASHSKGKKVPLNVSIKDDNDGIRVTITYSTPPGVASPEDAIKGHFCRTVAAAEHNNNNPTTKQSARTPSNATAANATQQSADSAANGNADIKNGNPCLGGVCVDDDLMTLGHIKWQKAAVRGFGTPIEHYKRTYEPKKHAGLFAPQSESITTAAGPYIEAKAFDSEGIAKLSKVKGFCQGRFELNGQFLSESGLSTNVTARVIPADDGQTQSIRVTQITRTYPAETTQEQRQQLKNALVARYSTVSQKVLLGQKPMRRAWKFDGTELNLYSGYSPLQEPADAFLRYPGCSKAVAVD